jgi:hypothetical protein
MYSVSLFFYYRLFCFMCVCVCLMKFVCELETNDNDNTIVGGHVQLSYMSGRLERGRGICTLILLQHIDSCPFEGCWPPQVL